MQICFLVTRWIVSNRQNQKDLFECFEYMQRFGTEITSNKCHHNIDNYSFYLQNSFIIHLTELNMYLYVWRAFLKCFPKKKLASTWTHNTILKNVSCKIRYIFSFICFYESHTSTLLLYSFKGVQPPLKDSRDTNIQLTNYALYM